MNTTTKRTYGMAVLLAVGVLCIAGCNNKDTRITLDRFREMEAATLEVEPIQVHSNQLLLTESRPYQVGPGDVLDITFTGLGEQFSQNVLAVRVHDNGRIMLPMVGMVEVGGLDLKGIEARLYELFVPKYVKDMSVFVRLGEAEMTTVVVVSPTGQSDLVRLPSNERNVLYALSRTIGMDTGGRGLIHVRPIRSDQPQVTYNLTDINDIRRVLSAAPLQSGDMIVVEPAGQNAVFVTGLVNMPGPVAVSRNDRISLVRTVAAAGGLRDFLDPPEATLWRRMPDGEQVRVKIELASIMSGKTGDVQLMPGDVLDVPHTPETRFREWAAANIRFGPFGVTAMYDPVADYRARILRNDTGDSGLIRQAFIQSLRTGVSELLVPPVSVSP